MHRIVASVLCCLLLALLVAAPGCQRDPVANNANANGAGHAASNPIEVNSGSVTFPELGPSKTIQPGIRYHEVMLQRAGVPMQLWVYLPEKADGGKFPLVLVPPAGSTLLAGMDLSEGDRPEHYPYVRAGFAVVSFEIDGHVPNMERAPRSAVIAGAKAFIAAQAGLANAKTALDFALTKLSTVNPTRVYVAGHSSAATLALLYAAHEPRLKGCAAFAAVTDVEERLRPALPGFRQAIPDIEDFLRSSSPKTHIKRLKCPVFLFHAEDDSNVPFYQASRFAEDLKKTNKEVTFVSTARGGHYESMLQEGVPRAIEWLKTLER